jgi:hypothetical protein
MVIVSLRSFGKIIGCEAGKLLGKLIEIQDDPVPCPVWPA